MNANAIARDLTGAPELEDEGRRLATFASLSGAPFDIVCPPDGYNARSLTAPAYYLDDACLSAHYRAADALMGALNDANGARMYQDIARRLTRKIAARAEARLGLGARTIEKAWFFAIASELCTLAPARRLARLLAKELTEKAAGALIVIPIGKADFHYLGYWSRNDLEPFYLAVALRRAGARVLLALTDDGPDRGARAREIRDGGRAELSFCPHAVWSAASDATPASPTAEPARRETGLAAIVPSGLRHIPAVAAENPDAVVYFSAHFSHMRKDGIEPWHGVPSPLRFTIALRRNWACAASSARVFSPDPLIPLPDLLIAALGKTTAAFKTAADRTVERLDIRAAHVCDHLFFESALIAQAVRDRGGAVTLWPHSSNPVHVDMHQPGEVDEIRCVLAFAAQRWAKRMPKTPCIVHSHNLLQPCHAPRWTHPDQPLHVVVFGTAHALERWPLLPRRRHEQAYRDLFAGLAALAPKVRTYFKPKGRWESAQWLRHVLDRDDAFEETHTPTHLLAYPNMVFLSVCFGSTALLEGLGRGIPCMIARDYPLEDYTYFDERSVPVGKVGDILQALAHCGEPGVIEALTRQELAWYASQTQF